MPPAKPLFRTRRLVYGAYVGATLLFVGPLATEIAGQIWAGEHPRTEGLSEPCARGVDGLYRAVDLAIRAGLGAEDADTAVERYRRARDEAWRDKDQVETTCKGDGVGLDAMAALARLDRKAEGLVRRQATELMTVRREVDSFIR